MKLKTKLLQEHLFSGFKRYLLHYPEEARLFNEATGISMKLSWIDSLLKETNEAETPRSYVYWAGIATISAIIAPNVWINRGGVYKLSPNVFIMLIGESGLGKGLPINLSKKLVRLVGSTRVISGRNTIQAIIKDIANSETDEKTGVPKWKDSRAFIVSGEFSTLLQEDKSALPVITELYDTHYSEDWDNKTKGAGIDRLKDVNITLFGGSTPEHFANVVPEADVKGGFVGRILTVYAEERWRINSLSDTDAELIFPFDKMSHHLKMISTIKGPFKYSKEAKKLWETWYVDIRTRKIHDPTGAVNRLPDNVLKVAMCIALSKKTELIIEEEDLTEAIDKCMHLTIDSRRLTGGKGGGDLGAATHMVIQMLFRAEGNYMLKSHILQRYYGEFDIYSLDRIIATLEAGDMVESAFLEGQVVLRLKAKCVENLNNYMERE